MHKNILILFLSCNSLIGFSQNKIKISTSFGIGMTKPKLYDDKAKSHISKGYFAGIVGEYKLNNSLSLISGLEYLRFKNNFQTPFYATTIPEVHFNIDNSVTINSINIPINLEYKLKNKFYTILGGGVNFNIIAKRYAQVIVTYDNAPKTDYETIADNKIKLKNVNPFFKFGIGKEINICTENLLAEITFWSQANKQTYGSIKNYTEIPSYKFKNQMLCFSLGYFLK